MHGEVMHKKMVTFMINDLAYEYDFGLYTPLLNCCYRTTQI